VFGKIPLLGRLGRKHSEKQGFADATPLRQVTPTVPSSLLAAVPDGTGVDLKVQIDPSGNVSEASLLSRDSQPVVANMVADAAREWQFEPARLNGKPVPSEMILHFRW
jgi:TonB family protein